MRCMLLISLLMLASCKAHAPDLLDAGPQPGDVTAETATDIVDAAADVSATGWQVQLKVTTAVSLLYSQGIARLPAGWAFSAKAGLWTTDEQFVQLVEAINPLPQALIDQGYGHLGDIDMADGKLYAGLEQSDFSLGKQAVAWFDPQTLAYQGTHDLAQHEDPCLCVDEATLTAYTPDHYTGTEIRRYDVKNDWAPLPSLFLSHQLDAMQGLDVANGALWFSCDDAVHGLYRADLVTGETLQIGTIGRLNATGTTFPEVEGIDASQTRNGFLHTLTNEPLQATSWVDEWTVTGL